MKCFGANSDTTVGLDFIDDLNELDDGERFLLCEGPSIFDFDLAPIITSDLLGKLVTFDTSSSNLFDENYAIETYRPGEVAVGAKELCAEVKLYNRETPASYIPVVHQTKDSEDFMGALFLDRDGVLVHGDLYSINRETVTINPQIIPHLQKATKKGIKIFIVTNQSGVGRGCYTEAELKDFHSFLEKELAEQDVIITHWYYSPFHTAAKDPYNKHSLLRKPFPGMVMNACKDYPVKLADSLMIGDRMTDQLWLPGLRVYLIEHTEDISNSFAPRFSHFDDLFGRFWSVVGG